jgi:hypothetical protein
MQAQLLEDVVRAVERIHAALEQTQDTEQRRQMLRGHAWTLAPMAMIHTHTGEERYLEWARQGLVQMVDSAVEPDGQVQPLLRSFREMQPFCETFLHLQRHQALSAAEAGRAQAQVEVSANTHLEATDWGAQNRATVDAAGFYFAAAAAPECANAARWRRYGDALNEDSWGRWSIEDASIYGPFWLFYLMTGAELNGRTDEFMSFATTRYYFELYRGLLMPNGMLPDWGDGDWTHMWQWYMATMVRAGSVYRNGEYLHFAERLYQTHREMGLREPIHGFLPEGLEQGDGLYCVATALRWLDPHLATQPYELRRSQELVDDLVSKKLIFRNDNGAASSYALLNYRDQGAYGRYQRDYQNQQLAAYEEKPHHGHGDENSLCLLMERGTVLLADGGYRREPHDGWRADLYHNRLVARLGWPIDHDVIGYLQQNRSYAPVQTEKIHFGNFGAMDYSRTRLVDEERGYTADRIVLFLVDPGVYIIVDAVHIEREGHKLFANMWHPDSVSGQGDLTVEDGQWVRSWPPRVPIRQEYWTNPHGCELLIEFLDNRDKYAQVREIDRRFNPSQAFFQFLYSHFFKGQRLAFVTVLTPHAPGSFSESMLGAVELIHDNERSFRTLGLRFSLNGAPVTVGLKLDQNIGLTNLRGRPMFDWRTGSVAYSELRTDADFAFVVDRGAEADMGFIYGSQLDYRGETLFDMPLNNRMYQGAVEGYRVPEGKDKMPRWRETVRR